MNACTETGCDREAYCRGLCDPHYRDALRSGRMKRVVRTRKPCSVEGCDELSRRRGWCHTHYMRWREHGHVEETRRAPVVGESPEALFESLVERTDSCWNWTGALAKGYGRINHAGSTYAAHRWSYEHHVGPIPEGLDIDHLCENTRCVNPDHLEPVTGPENTRRYHERKRARA